MHCFSSFLLLIYISTSVPRLSFVKCSFSPGMLKKYAKDRSWEQPWKHSTIKRGNTIEDEWKPIEINVHYLEGDEPPFSSKPNKKDWDFVKKAMDEVISIAKQLILEVRKHEGHKIEIPRHCLAEEQGEENIIDACECGKGQTCSKFGLCYEVPVPSEHSGPCRQKKADGTFETIYENKGNGAPGDLMIYVAIMDCKPEIANAAFCQRDPQYYRPMAGRIAICYKHVKKFISKPNQYVTVLLHELMHILTAPMSGEYYKHMNGTQRTNTRVRANRIWTSISGSFPRQAYLSTLPSVLEVAREHFNCSDLEGVELDNSTNNRQMPETNENFFGHFEMRLFPDALLSPQYLPGMGLTKLDVAYLKDTGWYKVNESMGRKMTVTRGKGCDFARLSCYDYMKHVNFDRLAMYPYCDMKDETKWMCSLDNSETGYCSGSMSDDTIEPEYQIQTSEMKFLGDHMTEYCPMVLPRWIAGDASPHCRETHSVDYRAIGAHGGHDNSQCVRVETLNVKGSKKCPSVKSKNLGLCVQTSCTPDSMSFEIGGQNFTCSKSDSGQRLNFNFVTDPNNCKMDGSFCCPDYEIFCPMYINSTTPIVLRFQYCSASKFSSNMLWLLILLVSFSSVTANMFCDV